MESGLQGHEANLCGLGGPNSVTVLYLDPLGIAHVETEREGVRVRVSVSVNVRAKVRVRVRVR